MAVSAQPIIVFVQDFASSSEITLREASPETSQPTFLDLCQGSAATDVRDSAQGTQHRKSLEQVPGGVVQEEDAFNSDDGAEKEAVRHRRIGERVGQLGEVSANLKPL